MQEEAITFLPLLHTFRAKRCLISASHSHTYTHTKCAITIFHHVFSIETPVCKRLLQNASQFPHHIPPMRHNILCTFVVNKILATQMPKTIIYNSRNHKGKRIPIFTSCQFTTYLNI